MQVGERPEMVRRLFTDFYRAIDEAEVEMAEKLLDVLVDIVGDSDPEISGARVTLDFEKMQEKMS